MDRRYLNLNIAKQVSPETNRPFFIVETYLTVDGHRSRIASGRFSTQEEAQTHIDTQQV